MKKFIIIACFMFSTLLQAEELKLLTWNVFMLPKPVKFSLQAERTPLIIKELKEGSYDVVLLQEAFSDDFRNQIKTHLFPHYPFHHHLGRKLGSLTIYGSGLYLLSRFPIISTEHVYYSDCSKADCFASKGALLTTLRLPGGKLAQIATTHLQAGKGNIPIRMKQLQQVKNLFKVAANPQLPLIFLGDMNIDALTGSDYQRALEFMGMVSTPLDGPINYTGGFPIDCYKKPGDDIKRWIDHVWIARGQAVKVRSKKVRPFLGTINNRECPLSDHYAVEAHLSL